MSAPTSEIQMPTTAPARPAARALRIPDAALIGVLLVVGLARWATRSRYLIDWDAVNYALGLTSFDVTRDQPHMPGYFLYIQIGRLLRPVVGDANTTLVLVSALFGALTPVLLYHVGSTLLGRRAGLLAAALGLTGPLFWFQSSVASSRTTEGYFALLVALLCLRVRRRNDLRAFWWLPFVLAATAGVRQQSVPFFLPMVLWATARVPIRLRLAAGVCLGVTSLLWAMPMLHAVGGLAQYRLLSGQQWTNFVVNDTGVPYAPSFADALHRLWGNVSRIGLYSFFAAPLGIALLPIALRAAVRAGGWRSESNRFLAVAAVPVLTFLTIFHIQQIGHAMSFAPYLVLAVCAGVRSLPRRFQIPVAFLVVAGNLAFALYGPPRFLGRQFAPTLAALRFNDGYLNALPAALRETAPAETTLVVATDTVSRPLDYYLPEYRSVTLLDRGGLGPTYLRHSAREAVERVGNSLLVPAAIRTFAFVARESALEVSPDGRRIHVTSRATDPGWWIAIPDRSRVRVIERDPARFVLVETDRPVAIFLSGDTATLAER